MIEDHKDNINKVDDQKIDEKQSSGESIPSDDKSSETSDLTAENQESVQSQGESETSEEIKKEHEVIHKKDGRLHIYIRQDKYKGELKSKNWVGRLYVDGKQKISSSGTPNLEEAIPILE